MERSFVVDETSTFCLPKFLPPIPNTDKTLVLKDPLALIRIKETPSLGVARIKIQRVPAALFCRGSIDIDARDIPYVVDYVLPSPEPRELLKRPPPVRLLDTESSTCGTHTPFESLPNCFSSMDWEYGCLLIAMVSRWRRSGLVSI